MQFLHIFLHNFFLLFFSQLFALLFLTQLQSLLINPSCSFFAVTSGPRSTERSVGHFSENCGTKRYFRPHLRSKSALRVGDRLPLLFRVLKPLPPPPPPSLCCELGQRPKSLKEANLDIFNCQRVCFYCRRQQRRERR